MKQTKSVINIVLSKHRESKESRESNEEIIKRIYDETGYKVDYESFIWGRRIGSIGVIKAIDENQNAFNTMRTAKATNTKQEQRAIKEKYVIDTYIKMINENKEKAILEILSENKMAQRVKERVEKDLSIAKTSGHKSVLKSRVGRNEKIIITGLSSKTIIRILRNRDKSKIQFYPWENK